MPAEANGSPKSSQQGEALAAINAALALLGRKPEGENSTAAPRGTVLATASVRPALETFVQARTLERLDAQRPNLKVLLKDLLDWKNAPGEATRANGNVVKATVQALQAKDPNGNSAYPQAVEMLGFVAAVAPLLQGDRIARIIAEAPKVSSAYGPTLSTLKCYAAASEILSRYPEQRREQLLISLWHKMHEGRFWDITAGVTQVTAQQQRRMNAAAREARDAATAYVQEILAGAQAGSDEANKAIVSALFEERLPHNEATVERVKALPESIELHDKLSQFSERVRRGDTIYPDQVVLLSTIPWAAPSERPESPVRWIMDQLASALVPDRVNDLPPMLDKLPDKPKTWEELFPNDVVVGFPHPPAARALDNVVLPGTTDVMSRVIKNTAELVENRDLMGNCTYSYRNSMEEGRYVLLLLQAGDEFYNASITCYRGQAWAVGEVNSRFNRGNVPPQIRQAVEAIARQLPPLAQEGQRGRKIEARNRQFSMLS